MGQGRVSSVFLQLKLRRGQMTSPPFLPAPPTPMAKTESQDHNKLEDHAGESYHKKEREYIHIK